MDPRCKLLLVMGKNDPNNPDPYRQQSVVVVPLPHPGVKISRHTTVMGYDVRPQLNPPNVRMPLMGMQRLSLTTFECRKRTWFSAKEEALRSSKAV